MPHQTKIHFFDSPGRCLDKRLQKTLSRACSYVGKLSPVFTSFIGPFEDKSGLEFIQRVCTENPQEMHLDSPLLTQGGNSHRLGYGMCHFLRVLFWLKNKDLGLFYSF